jgi:hypothetical protein
LVAEDVTDLGPQLVVFYEVAVGVDIEFRDVDAVFGGNYDLSYRDGFEEGMDIHLVLILAARGLDGVLTASSVIFGCY